MLVIGQLCLRGGGNAGHRVCKLAWGGGPEIMSHDVLVGGSVSKAKMLHYHHFCSDQKRQRQQKTTSPVYSWNPKRNFISNEQCPIL
jgi:hypothetical protein